MKKILPVLFLLIAAGCAPAKADAPKQPAASSAPAAAPASTPAPQASASAPLVGEAFGKPVTKDEFDFSYKTTQIFSVNGKEADSEEARRIEAWKHIILLREARERGVEVSRAELEAEMKRLLAEKNIEYGSYNYVLWVQQTFGEEPDKLERRILELLIVKKMVNGIMNPPPPVITDEECKQKFLNQYNSMNVEFVNLPTLEEAQALKKTITPEEWDAKKAADKKWCTPTGHISLEAVIDLWQVPTPDAYRIHAMKIGEISDPAKMYKGYGVFRLREKKEADPAQYDDKKKEEYKKVLTQVYYYNKTQKVIQDIFNRAAFKDYDRDKIMVFETSEGTFECQLYTAVAPKACENFIGLAEKGYYDGTIFHRVIDRFMIQGGDPLGTGAGGESFWGAPFEDEVQEKVQFEKGGILAMANSGPNTNKSQFFVTLSPQPGLNMKHTIFGEVINGFEVVRKIGKAEVGPNDKPVKDQKINRLYLKKWQR